MGFLSEFTPAQLVGRDATEETKVQASHLLAATGSTLALVGLIAAPILLGTEAIPETVTEAGGHFISVPWMTLAAGVSALPLGYTVTKRVPRTVVVGKPPKFGKYKWSMPIGRTYHGKWVYHNWADIPHAKVAGCTGSGKSEMLKSLVAFLAMTHTPEECQFVLVDLKEGESFSAFRHLPHVQGMYWEYDDVKTVFEQVTQLIRKRAGTVRDAKFKFQKPARFPHVFVVIDEGGELAPAKTVDEEQKKVRQLCQNFVSYMARIGRSACVHVVFGTQRPSNETLPTDIRGQLEATYCLRTENELDSEIILRHKGAERLPHIPGRMIFKTPDGEKHVQGAYIPDSVMELWLRAWQGVELDGQFEVPRPSRPSANVLDYTTANKVDRQAGHVPTLSGIEFVDSLED